MPLIRQVIAAQQAGNADQARELLQQEARPAFVEWPGRINQFITLQETLSQSEAQTTMNVAHGFQFLMRVLTSVAIALGGAVAYAITRHLTRTLGAKP